MSFIKIPNRIHYGSKSIEDYYRGVSENYGEYLYKIPTGTDTFKYVKTQSLLSFTFTDSYQNWEFQYTGYDCGGEPVFGYGSNWRYKIYFIPSWSKWILIENAPWIGYIPRSTAEQDTDPDTHQTTYTYTGDIWWESSTFNTMPYDNAVAGTFTFGLSSWVSRFPDLAQYDNITHTITGDVTAPVAKLVSGYGPTGKYDDGTFVGFPEWRYTHNNGYKYIVKYGDRYSDWRNLERYRNLRYVDDKSLSTTWTGWVATEIMGEPNANPTGGFYAYVGSNPIDPPDIENDITFQWYHFVPDDPDDPESYGVLQHDAYWEDEDGNRHNMPDIVASWRGIMNEHSVHIGLSKIVSKICMGEAAIWR